MIEKIHSTDVIEIANKLNEIIDFLNDTFLMKETDGQYITLNDSVSLAVGTISKLNDVCVSVRNSESTKGTVKCPHCGVSYYQEMYSDSTCVYYPPIWKDGKNINTDRNTIRTHCKCLNCGKEFDI